MFILELINVFYELLSRRAMEINEFGEKVSKIIEEIAGKPIEKPLARHLNTKFPAESAIFQQFRRTPLQTIEVSHFT